jgi:hypothetical protein
MSQLWELSAWDLARRIRAREVSSTEVIQAHLKRIDAVNPHVNAITTGLAEQALADADTIDQALRTGTCADGAAAIPGTRRSPSTVRPWRHRSGCPYGRGRDRGGTTTAYADRPALIRLLSQEAERVEGVFQPLSVAAGRASVVATRPGGLLGERHGVVEDRA